MLVNYNCNQSWVDQTLVNEELTTKCIIYIIAVPILGDSQDPNRPSALVTLKLEGHPLGDPN